MRLSRIEGPKEGTGYLVAEVPPPNVAVTAPVDLDASFAREYRRLHAPLVSYAERFVSREEAKDAVGEAIESIWRRWPAVVREKRTDSYFYSAVHYAVFARIDANSKLVTMEEAEAELDQRVVDDATHAPQGETWVQVIATTIAAMPAKRQAVILLLKERNLSYAEAAEVLGVSLGTINTHVRLAYEDLRAALHGAGFALPGTKSTLLPPPKGGDSND